MKRQVKAYRAKQMGDLPRLETGSRSSKHEQGKRGPALSCSCLLPLLPGFLVSGYIVQTVKYEQLARHPLEGLNCGDFCGWAAGAFERLSLFTPLVNDYVQALEHGRLWFRCDYFL